MSHNLDEFDHQIRELREELALLRDELAGRGMTEMHKHLFAALSPEQALCWAPGDLREAVAEAKAARDCHEGLMRAIGWKGAA